MWVCFTEVVCFEKNPGTKYHKSVVQAERCFLIYTEHLKLNSHKLEQKLLWQSCESTVSERDSTEPMSSSNIGECIIVLSF